MEMKEVTTFQLPDEIVQPFTIGNVGQMMAVCSKEQTFVMQLKYKHFVEDGAINYVLSRFKCSTARPTGLLVADETALYNDSDIEQRKQIMLDQTIFPHIAKVFINNVQSWISPMGTFEDDPNEHLIANLTNMGQLTIYRQEEEWISKWNPYVDVSAAWVKHIYDGEKIEHFQHLQMMIDDILITCFCWQDKVEQHPVRFAFGTKSGKIVLCTLYANEPQIVHVHQQLETAFLLKYATICSTDHFLLAGLRTGRVAVYRFENQITLVGESWQRIGTFFDEDLTASAIEWEVDSKHNRLMLLVAKGSFLVVVNASITGEILGTASLDLGHFMITGLQQVEKYKYIASTMEGAISLVSINRLLDGGIKLREETIKSDLNVGSYALYGVTATHTRSCWLFLGYPSKRFDHLSLRSPTCVFFAQYSLCEPLHTLKSNRTLKMTGHYDAAEVVRHNGNKNTDTLKELENANLKPSLSDSFAYKLKLQLIQLGAKMAYQSRRNKATTEILHNQLQFLCTLIEVINACKVLSNLAGIAQSKRVLNLPQQNAALCLRNFIHGIAEDSFPGDYEYMHLGLKPMLEETLKQTASMPRQAFEFCSFCHAKMAPNRGMCRKDHPVFRCVLTKIQIPLDGNESTCDMCQRYSVRPDMLEQVFENEGNPPVIDYNQCCVCDVPFRIAH